MGRVYRNGMNISSGSINVTLAAGGGTALYDTGGVLVGSEAYKGDLFELNIAMSGTTANGMASITILYKEI